MNLLRFQISQAAYFIIFIGFLGASPGFAGASPEVPPEGSDTAQGAWARQGRLRFVPKSFKGVPDQATRMEIGMRDKLRGDDPMPELFVLLPEKVAITTEADPSLFWYLSEPVDCPIKITINSPSSVVPVLSLTLDGATMQGIQRVDLSMLGITLAPNVRYEWVVAVEVNRRSPQENIFAKSTLWRTPMSQPLADRLTGKDRFERAIIAAEEGLWIDALAGISDLIDQHPRDRAWRQDRADILRQVDFDVVINASTDGEYQEHIRLAHRSDAHAGP